LNEELVHGALDKSLSTNPDIKAQQEEAWDEYINGSYPSTLIEDGLNKIVQSIRERYNPGDLIYMMDPTDSASPQLILLIEDRGREGWIGLMDGTLEEIPLRQWIREDHWHLKDD